MNLLKFDVTVYKDAVTVDLGTLTDDYIEIGTTALDKATGSHLSQAKDKIMLVDTVEYSGLKKGQEYRLTGILMDAESGEPLLVEGKKITAEKAFTAKKAEGKTEVSFTFDASGLSGKTTVVFESVTQDGKEVAVHADLEDESQQIFFPEIGTKAECADTGTQMGEAKEQLTIKDTVSYHLIPGKEYKVSGSLMDKETNEPVLDNGKPVTSELVFTPEKAEGSVELTFTFDASALKGKTVVAFETVSYLEKEVAVHADIEDEGNVLLPGCHAVRR